MARIEDIDRLASLKYEIETIERVMVSLEMAPSVRIQIEGLGFDKKRYKSIVSVDCTDKTLSEHKTLSIVEDINIESGVGKLISSIQMQLLKRKKKLLKEIESI